VGRNLLFIFFLFIACQVQAQKKYVLPRGLKINFINIHNNKVYLGSEGMLLHLEANSFESIQSKNATEQLTCAFTFKDTLWIGSSKGNIYYLKGKQLYLYEFNTKRFYFPIIQLGFTQKGIMWLATKNGVYYLSNKWNKISETEGLPDNNCNDAFIKNDTLIIATDRGVAFIDGKNNFKIFNKLSQNNGLTDNLIQKICHTGEGIYLINTNERSQAIDSRGAALSEVNFAPNAAHIFCLKDKSIQGYVNAQQGLVLQQNKQTLFTNASIKKALISADNYGDFWAATNDTLYFYNLQAWLNKAKLYPHEVHALAMRDTQIIAASANEIYTQKSAIKLTTPASITALVPTSQDQLLIGTLGNGVYNFNGTLKPISEAHKALNVTNISMVSDTIYVSALEGVFLFYNTINGFKADTPAWVDQLPSKYIYGITKDSNNNLWIASDGDGIIQVSNQKLIYHNKQFKFPSKTVYSIKAGKQAIYASAADNKIFRFANKQWQLVLKAHAGESFIPALQVLNNDVFVLSSLGVYKLSDKSIAAQPNIQFYYFQDLFTKINTTDLNAFTLNKNELVFINDGHPQSLSLAYLESLQLQASISELIVGDKKYFSAFPKELPHDENSLQLLLNVNYYPGLNNVAYKYRMLGINNQWENTNDKKLTFLNLRPGKYTLQLVPVINGIPFYEKIFVYELRILSPLWQRPWFIALASLALLALAAMAYKRRTASLQMNEERKREKLNYEIKVLKSQINPHFLFNSFNSLIATINLDPEKAIVYAQNLSDYFRHILKYQEQDTITLAEEVDLLERYYTLQQMRFEDSIKLNLDKALQQYASNNIPPLSLQLLFENAIKHNAILANKPLIFSVSIKGGYIVCENEIRPKNSSADSGGIGLANINQRYITLFNKEIHYEEKNKHFIVSLPLIK
jgi:ligand-binding sensor domain-containing protein